MPYVEKGKEIHPGGKPEPRLGTIDHLRWSQEASRLRHPKEPIPTVGEAVNTLKNAIVQSVKNEIKNW